MPKRPEDTATPTAPLVPVDEVMARIGYGREMLSECASWTGEQPEIVEDWTGEPCMPVETAARFLSGTQAYMQSHYAKWDAYRAYIEERKQAAERQRQTRAALEREAAQRLAKQRQEQWTAELARKTEEDIAAREREKARREGEPMSPEQFFKRAG